jgi:uncharacterized protein HemX
MFGALRAYAIAAVVIAGASGAGYLYYTSTQAKMKLLEQQATTAVNANRTLEATIGDLQANAQRQQELTNELQTNLAAREEELGRLRGILIDHDLTDLSLRRPGLIERRINDATKDVFDSLESITAN